MKKNDQKGFMLVEAFIVSTLVLAVLVFMFIQIRTVVNGFDKSFSYNTVPGLYIVNELGEFVKQKGYATELLESEGYIIHSYDAYAKTSISENDLWNEMLKNSNVKNVVISVSDTAKLKSSLSAEISSGLKDYAGTLKVDSSTEHRILVEFNDNTYASIKII